MPTLSLCGKTGRRSPTLLADSTCYKKEDQTNRPLVNFNGDCFLIAVALSEIRPRVVQFSGSRACNFKFPSR